jgi:hypothetical protein
MAVVQKRLCKGIFVRQVEGGRVVFCAVTENLGVTRETYLIDASGAAAELLVLGKIVNEPVSDKKSFSLSDAPPWDATVAEAKTILTPYINVIRRIAEAIQHFRASTLLTTLPEIDIDGSMLRQVLSTEDINRAFVDVS